MQQPKLDLTLVVKADNRKKINSHDIFYNGFVTHLKSEFFFMTDCGTLFDPQCLLLLWLRIKKDPRCIAVTGRQRVMTKEQQVDCATEGRTARFLRSVQGYDYE